MKYSNYKVLKCYKLVFRVKSIYLIGSILTLIYFTGYAISFFIFLYRKLLYIKDAIAHLYNKRKGVDKKNEKAFRNSHKNLIEDKRNNKEKEMKKNEKKHHKKDDLIERKNKMKSKSHRHKKSKYIHENETHEDFPPKRKSSLKRDLKNDKNLKNKGERRKRYLSHKKLSSIETHHKIELSNSNGEEIEEEKNEKNLETDHKFHLKEKTENKDDKKSAVLSDFELNNLEYLEAIESDNRNYFRVYWSILRREHNILFTFFTWNDYNIFSIKLSKFFFLICTDMALNVFFFSDESMHNIYVSGGEFNFFDHVTQMFLTTLVSQLLSVFLNFLTMTDIHYYNIKSMALNELNKKKIVSVMKLIKCKIIVYYIFTFILYFFYWYTITAFCAVYRNTQNIFITDSISSFIMGLIYPF